MLASKKPTVLRLRLHPLIPACLALAFAFTAKAQDVQLPEAVRFTLPNGVQAILAKKSDVPLVAARIVIVGGALADAPGKEGTSALLAELLAKGAGKRDAKAYVEAAANVGGEISFSASREALLASADFLAEDSTLMLELLADALMRPKLDEAEFTKLRERSIATITAAKDGGGRGLIGAYADAWLFRDHPYGRPINGDERSLATISPSDITAYFREHTGSDRAIISIVGDIDTDAMKQKITTTFASWPHAQGERPTAPPALKQNETRVLLIDKPDAAQTHFHISNIGAAVSDPAQAAQDLVQTVFGGRFTSMLNSELRVKSGLTYGARAALTRYAMPGSAGYASFTRTDATAQAIDLALETQDRLHHDGLDAATLASAKRYVRGQFAPEYETDEQVAGAFANLSLHGLSEDQIEGYASRIQAVTLDEANAARSVFPQTNANVIVVIGDAEKIGDAVAKYGPVTRMKISDPGFAPPRH